MRARLALTFVGLSLLSPGCELFYLAGNDLTHEVEQRTDDLLSCLHYRELAKEAWNDVQKANPDVVFSVHYIQGFKDAYADYLNFGGSADPPPLPPRRYRKVTNQTPEGRQAIENWFAGFRHGAKAAQDSGYRQLVTVPTTVPESGIVVPDPSMAVVGPVPLISPSAPSRAPTQELLPPPRQLPASDDKVTR